MVLLVKNARDCLASDEKALVRRYDHYWREIYNFGIDAVPVFARVSESRYE